MKNIRIALFFLIVMTLLTGVVYPLLITLIGKVALPYQANGSFLSLNGKTVGSALIAQKFTDPRYFWPRPSAGDYNPLVSGGSNLGLGSKAFQQQLQNTPNLSADLRQASGSGLDPHISPASAKSQVDRIIKARGLDQSGQTKLLELLAKYTEPRTLGLFGEPRVNVLKLNLAMAAGF